MRTAAPWIALALSALLYADADELVRRASVRLEHENHEGAKALLDRALAEEPSHGASLELLADLGDTRDRLRYLERARPLRPEAARRQLEELDDEVFWVPDAAVEAAERDTLLPSGQAIEPFGPWRPWERPYVVWAHASSSGPLRFEALGARVPGHREALARIADRFKRDGVTDAACWALLARLQARTGTADAARTSLARARPASLDDRTWVAMCALEVVESPYEWWRAEGTSLVADLAAAGPSQGRTRARWLLWSAARRLLAERHDVEGLATLSETQARTDGFSTSWNPYEQDVEEVDASWRLDEALPTLLGRTDEPSVCLRSAILIRLGQVNASLAELDALLDHAPECLSARFLRYRTFARLRCLGGACGDAETLLGADSRGSVRLDGLLLSELVRLIESVRGDAAALAALRAMPPDGRHGVVASYYTDHLVRDHRGTELVNEMLEALSRSDALNAWNLTFLACLATEAGRPEVVLGALDGVPEKGWRYLGESWLRGLAHGRPVPNACGVLRWFASRDALTGAQDAFLRRALSGLATDVGLRWRVRRELEGDREFEALPGGRYVLALLHDAYLESGTVRALRRAAYDAGFRARGLLVDMAQDGEEVIEDLEALDPISARLARAVRAPGVEALDRLLEEDAAWPWQIEQVRHERDLRVGTRVLPGPSPEPASPGDAARAFWLGLEEGRRPPEQPPDFDSMDPANLASAFEHWRYWTEWQRAAERAVAADPGAACCALLGAPNGPRLADWLCGSGRGQDCAELLKELWRQAAAHPEDLRWLDLARQIAYLRNDANGQKRAIDALRPHRSRSPEIELAIAADAAPIEERREALRRYLKLREGDAFAAIAEGLLPRGMGKEDPLAAVRLQALTALARTDRDRDLLSSALLRAGCAGESTRLDESLAASEDAGVRFAALTRAWKKANGRPQPDLDHWRKLATDPRWDDAQAAALWTCVGVEACFAGRDDLFAEAMNETWRRGPLPKTLYTESLVDFLPVSQLAEQPVFAETISRALKRPDASPAAWYVARWVWSKGGGSRTAALPIDERLHDEGLPTSRTWARRLAASGREATLRGCGELCRSFRTVRECWEGGGLVEALCRALVEAGRPDEAFSCADAWSMRCGLLGRDDRGGGLFCGLVAPPYRFFGMEESFEETAMPPRAIAAGILLEVGQSEGALDRLREALREARDPSVREACLRSAIGIELGAAFLAEEDELRWRVPPTQRGFSSCFTAAQEAVILLSGLMTSAADPWAREEAHDQLAGLYAFQELRPCFIDLLLRDVVAPPLPEELRAWERRLRADAVADRDVAEAELRGLGPSALGLLRELRRTDDAEVRARAWSLLEELATP